MLNKGGMAIGDQLWFMKVVKFYVPHDLFSQAQYI